MAERSAGPICSSQLGESWVDAGTLALQRTTAPGVSGTNVCSAPIVPDAETLYSGQIPYAIGQASVVRIPIPGTGGLAIELKTRDPRWVDRSTSRLFFQDAAGKRNLRLDYGYNKITKTIDYHWNQSAKHSNFGITDHAPAGKGGVTAYQVAK